MTAKKHIVSKITLEGSGIGLTPQSANIEHCRQALEYLSEGQITLREIDGRYALVGDRSEESEMIGFFFQESLKDGILQNINPIARLAHIINRLASQLDAHAPIGVPGIPSRMQILFAIQHNAEQDRNR